MATRKAPSGEIAFKATNATQAAFEKQAAFATSEAREEACSLERKSLKGLGRSADLRVFNHEVAQS